MHSHSLVIMHISNIGLPVLSKATRLTLQKHCDYDYDRKNKVRAPSLVLKNSDQSKIEMIYT